MKHGFDVRAYVFEYYSGKVMVPCTVQHQYALPGSMSQAFIALDFSSMSVGGRVPEGFYTKTFTRDVKGRNRWEIRQNAKHIARESGKGIVKHLRSDGKITI